MTGLVMIVVGSAVWAAAPAAGAGPKGGTSSCVACHRSAGGASELRHTYGDWAKSIHAVKGVGCEHCHGGNAAKADKAGAHAGMLDSSDPKSPVYYTRVPETCGRCHAGELAAFKESRHFLEFSTTGKGPNCITCHGAMANHILDPQTMAMTCTLCHRRPTQAFGALLSLNHAAGSTRRLKRAVAAARAKGVEASAQERELASVTRLVEASLVHWHTFRMPEVLSSSQEAARRAITALNELKLKGMSEGEAK